MGYLYLLVCTGQAATGGVAGWVRLTTAGAKTSVLTSAASTICNSLPDSVLATDTPKSFLRHLKQLALALTLGLRPWPWPWPRSEALSSFEALALALTLGLRLCPWSWRLTPWPRHTCVCYCLLHDLTELYHALLRHAWTIAKSYE